MKLFCLPVAGKTELRQRNCADKQEEHDSLGLAYTFIPNTAIERCVDIQREHCRLPGRGADGQGQVLVEEFERVGKRQERTNRDSRHNQRDDDLNQHLPVVGPIDPAASTTSGEIPWMAAI